MSSYWDTDSLVLYFWWCSLGFKARVDLAEGYVKDIPSGSSLVQHLQAVM